MRASMAVLGWVLATASVCGCGSGTSDDPLAGFIGSWSAISGTYNETCNDGMNTSGALTGTIVLKRGSTSDLVTVPGDGICPLNLTVAGSVASFVPGTCGIETVIASTLTLQADLRTADLVASDRFAYPTTICQDTTQGTYRKQ